MVLLFNKSDRVDEGRSFYTDAYIFFATVSKFSVTGDSSGDFLAFL